MTHTIHDIQLDDRDGHTIQIRLSQHDSLFLGRTFTVDCWIDGIPRRNRWTLDTAWERHARFAYLRLTRAILRDPSRALTLI